MEIIGKEIEVGFGVEETRGTAQGTAEKWMKKVTANVVERAEKVTDDASRGRLEDSDGSRIVKKWVEGDIEGIVHADAIGYILYNLYGSVSSSVVLGSVYDHVFNISNAIQHASLSVFMKDGGVQQLSMSNCMVGTFNLSGAVDDYVRFTTSIMGSSATDNSDTPSYDTEYDFIGKDIEVKIADSEAGLSGATAIKAKSVDVTFDQGLISDHIVGQYAPDDVYNSMMSIEGEITLNFANETYKDLYLADTSKYMQIKIQGSADIGGGSNPTITLLLNKVQFQDWNRSGGNDELVAETLSFKAFYNATDGKQSQLTLRNLTTEYSSPISA